MVMRSTILKKKKIDFEALGYKTMMETGDEMITRDICGLHIQAFADELKPELSRLSSDIQQTKARRQALWSHLYDRHEPVSDARMLGWAIEAVVLAVMTVVASVASAGGHAMTFYLFGSGLPISLIFGLTI